MPERGVCCAGQSNSARLLGHGQALQPTCGTDRRSTTDCWHCGASRLSGCPHLEQAQAAAASRAHQHLCCRIATAKSLRACTVGTGAGVGAAGKQALTSAAAPTLQKTHPAHKRPAQLHRRARSRRSDHQPPPTHNRHQLQHTTPCPSPAGPPTAALPNDPAAAAACGWARIRSRRRSAAWSSGGGRSVPADRPPPPAAAG